MNPLGEHLADFAATPDGAAENAAGLRSAQQSVLKIPVSLQVVIGSTRLQLGKVAALAPGSVVTLDQALGSPAVIMVNGREVAHGDLFVMDGEGDRLGIRITSVIAAGSGPVA